MDQLKALIGEAKAADVAVQAADNAKGHGAIEPIGMAQGNGPVARLERVGITQWGRLEFLRR